MKLIGISKSLQRRSSGESLVKRVVRGVRRFRTRRAFVKAANKFTKGVELSVFDTGDFFEFLYRHYKPGGKSEQAVLDKLKEEHKANLDPLKEFAELRFETPQELAILSRFYLYKADQISQSANTRGKFGPIVASDYIQYAAAVNKVRAKMLRYASLKNAARLKRLGQGKQS